MPRVRTWNEPAVCPQACVGSSEEEAAFQVRAHLHHHPAASRAPLHMKRGSDDAPAGDWLSERLHCFQEDKLAPRKWEQGKRPELNNMLTQRRKNVEMGEFLLCFVKDYGRDYEFKVSFWQQNEQIFPFSSSPLSRDDFASRHHTGAMCHAEHPVCYKSPSCELIPESTNRKQ